MHCSKKQPNHEYKLNGKPMTGVTIVVDVGIVKLLNSKYCEYCQTFAFKAASQAFAIHRLQLQIEVSAMASIQDLSKDQINVLFSGLKPRLTSDIALVEGVQQCFTKLISGHEDLSYSNRLRSLGVLSLQHTRSLSIMVTTFKCSYNHVNCSPSTQGLCRHSKRVQT